jgi:hypothetical protein
LLDALKGCGFGSGVVPGPETLGKMHELGPSLLHAFEASASNAKCPMQPMDDASKSISRERS